MTRLPTHLLVSALIRRVGDAGGHATVLGRGDRDGGMVLILASERGGNLRFLERGYDLAGKEALVPTGPASIAEDREATEYWQRRRSFDPDLWVVEVDIASAERFAAETIAGN